MSLVMGLDPGGTTGWAVYNLEMDTWEFGILTDNHTSALWELLEEIRPDYIACERFVKRPNNKAAELVSLGYQEIAVLWSEKNGRTLRLQNVSDAKSVWPNKKIKKTTIKLPSSVHARDAVRHVLLYLQKDLQDFRYVIQATYPGK